MNIVESMIAKSLSRHCNTSKLLSIIKT